jgi:hypothetical protein
VLHMCVAQSQACHRPHRWTTAGQPPSSGKLGKDGPENARDKHMGGVASSLAVCAEDRAKPVMDACLYICNICGVQPTVTDPSPWRKPHTG